MGNSHVCDPTWTRTPDFKRARVQFIYHFHKHPCSSPVPVCDPWSPWAPSYWDQWRETGNPYLVGVYRCQVTCTRDPLEDVRKLTQATEPCQTHV